MTHRRAISRSRSAAARALISVTTLVGVLLAGGLVAVAAGPAPVHDLLRATSTPCDADGVHFTSEATAGGNATRATISDVDSAACLGQLLLIGVDVGSSPTNATTYYASASVQAGQDTYGFALNASLKDQLDPVTYAITGTPLATPLRVIDFAAIQIALVTPNTPSPTPTPTPTAPPDPGPGPGPAPEPSPTTTPLQPPDLGPIMENANRLPGQETVTVDGVRIPVIVDANSTNTGLDISGHGFTLHLSALDRHGKPAPLGAGGVLRLARGLSVAVSGTGMRPNSPVRLYLLPSAVPLATLTSDAAGTFQAIVPVPPDLRPGTYTLQLNGITPDGLVRSVSLGVQVANQTPITTAVGTRIYFDYQSAKLTSKAKKSLRALAGQVPDGSATRTLVVAMIRSVGATPSDKALAKARATTVARYLRRYGLEGDILTTTAKLDVHNEPLDRRVRVTIAITQ